MLIIIMLNSFLEIMLAVVFILLCIILCRAYGVILIYVYIVFMVFSVLDEIGVLPIHLGDNT